MPASFNYSGGNTLRFDVPLLTAKIISRPNRYVAIIELPDGSSARAHVPVGGRIGGLTLDRLPCLISGPYAGRSKDYTVEAIGSHYTLDESNFQWIGINQTASNSYIRAFLKAELLSEITNSTSGSDGSNELRPEAVLDGSRIDFFLPGMDESNLWIEVKTPLIKLSTSIDPLLPVQTDFGKGAPSNRMPDQMEKVCAEIRKGHRGVLLGAFGYNLDTISSSATSEDRYLANLNLDGWVDRGKLLGLEFWEVTFAINPESIELMTCQRLFSK